MNTQPYFSISADEDEKTIYLDWHLHIRQREPLVDRLREKCRDQGWVFGKNWTSHTTRTGRNGYVFDDFEKLVIFKLIAVGVLET